MTTLYFRSFVADGVKMSLVERGCLKTYGFPPGCHDVLEYYNRSKSPSSLSGSPNVGRSASGVFGDSGSGSNEDQANYTEEKGVMCYCDTNRCNNANFTKIGDKYPGKGSAQTTDSHNFILACVLALTAVITLSAASGD